jgi:NADPH-dependent 2,4-dienoyl-CoA reductase/sulfur reductase-like enzyme
MEAVVVVGASLAGLRAAEALRREGYAGRLTLVGDEAHLPYQRPPLSKQFLAGAWEREKIDLRRKPDLDVEFRLRTPATALDLSAREVVVRGGDGREERLRFDGLVVATGARPRLLPESVAPRAMRGVFTLRTVDDCLALRDALQRRPRVVVIGGGFIGSEVAATCRGMDLQVTLLEADEAPMHRALGAQMGRVMHEVHVEHGTNVRVRTLAEALVGDGRVEGVRLEGGEVIPADVVVVGLGVVPNTDWLEESGLRLDDGLLCDARCAAVGVEGVVAAGDVARWHHEELGRTVRVEHWDNAIQQAATAARTLLQGGRAEPYRPMPFFWSDQYDARLQLIGMPEPGDEVRVIEGSAEERRLVAAYGRAGRTVAVLTLNAIRRTGAYQGLVEEGAPFPPQPPPEHRPRPGNPRSQPAEAAPGRR